MSDLVAIRTPRRAIPKGSLARLRDLSHEELRGWMQTNLPGPAFRTEQLFEWLHGKRADSFDEMTNLSRRDRERLVELAELPRLTLDLVQRSSDGTRKLRLRTLDDRAIEAVLIPNDERGLTLCVSSMIGCSLTCAFCATMTLGFERNLATWEILDQVYWSLDLLAQEHDEHGYAPRLTNIVFMGMGEPLHNYNQVKRAIGLITHKKGAGLAGRRITVSTAGLVPAIQRFGAEGLGESVGLAISLNASNDEQRDRLMPINTRWNIATLLQTVREVPPNKRRDVTFEYVLLADENDSVADAQRVIALLREFRCHVNVIPWNPHPAAPFRRPTDARVRAFVNELRRGGLDVWVRTPRGDDIDAACGQLALKGQPAGDRTGCAPGSTPDT